MTLQFMQQLFRKTAALTLLVFAAAALSSSNAAWAGPITYQLTGIVSGTLGTTNLTNVSFTLTGEGDSTGVFEPDTGIFVNPLTSATVSLAGIGVEPAIDAFYFFTNQNLPGGGFIDVFTGDVVDFGASEFATYDGVSPLGPISDVSQTFLAPFDLTGGTLNLVSATGLVFTATAATTTPEPSTFALYGLGVASLAVVKSRVKRRRMM